MSDEIYDNLDKAAKIVKLIDYQKSVSIQFMSMTGNWHWCRLIGHTAQNSSDNLPSRQSSLLRKVRGGLPLLLLLGLLLLLLKQLLFYKYTNITTMSV